MGQNKKASPEDIVLHRGRRTKHGGYSFIRTGKLPKNRVKVERYLTWLRMTYAEDIAGEEANMTAGQTVLLNKLILLEGLCRCIEITTAEIAEKTDRLYNMPVKYLSYVNSIAKICSLLGIERKKQTEEEQSILDYIEENYPEKESAKVTGRTEKPQDARSFKSKGKGIKKS